MNVIHFRYFILFIIVNSSILLQANSDLDSILISRNNQLSDYYHFRDEMKERTWINMVNLNDKALLLIKSDNQIIDSYLKYEMNKTATLNDKLEQVNLEASLLTREVEVNAMILEEQRLLSNKLFIITAILIIMFIAILIFFIDRHIRYRSIKMEVERLYSRSEESPRSIDSTIISDYQLKIEKLTQQNEKINNQLTQLLKQKVNQEKELQNEVNTRKEVESEISQLISQIKELSE